MTSPKPQKPSNVVEWFKVVGIVCGGLIAFGTVMHFLGATGSSLAMAPVRYEIAASADTIMAAVRRNRAESRRADDSLRVLVTSGQSEIRSELHDIHSLLIEQARYRGR